MALFTLFERKILRISQFRVGPQKVGIKGLLQPFADALKLFSKRRNQPNISYEYIYIYASFFFLLIPIILRIFKFFDWGIRWFKTFLFILMFFSFNVYGSVITGWSSNSKYSLIGRVRRIAQTISYEIVIGTFFLFLAFIISSLYILYVKKYNSLIELIYPIFIFFVVLLFTLIIELNRTPFDLAECESELVSGFNVEYGAIEFSLIFLGENLIVLLRSFIISSLFFSFDCSIFFVYYFVWIRARFPRQRFDIMIMLCWIILLPFILNINWGIFIFTVML